MNWMLKNKKCFIFFIIIFLIVYLDQLTKYVISNQIEYASHLSIIDNFFYLTYVNNDGGAWSMLSGQTTFLILIGVVASVVVFISLIRSKSKAYNYMISIFMGGLIGNLIDRIFNGGKVIDFLGFYIFDYAFPIFNVADIFLVISVIILGIYLLFFDKEDKKHD